MPCALDACCTSDGSGGQIDFCEHWANERGFDFVPCTEDDCPWDKCMDTIGHHTNEFCWTHVTSKGGGCPGSGANNEGTPHCCQCGVGCPGCIDELKVLRSMAAARNGTRFMRVRAGFVDAEGHSLVDLEANSKVLMSHNIAFDRASCFTTGQSSPHVECFGTHVCQCWEPLTQVVGGDGGDCQGSSNTVCSPSSTGLPVSGFQAEWMMSKGIEWPPETGENDHKSTTFCKQLKFDNAQTTYITDGRDNQTVFVNTNGPCTSNLLVAAAGKTAAATNCSRTGQRLACAITDRELQELDGTPAPEYPFYMDSKFGGSTTCKNMARDIAIRGTPRFSPLSGLPDWERRIRNDALDLVFATPATEFPAPGNADGIVKFDRIEHEGHVQDNNSNFGYWSRKWDSVAEEITDTQSLPTIAVLDGSTTRFGCHVTARLVAVKVHVRFHIQVQHEVFLNTDFVHAHYFAPYVVGFVEIETGVVAEIDDAQCNPAITITNGSPPSIPPTVTPTGNSLRLAYADDPGKVIPIPNKITWKGMLNKTTVPPTVYTTSPGYGIGLERINVRDAIGRLGDGNGGFSVTGWPTHLSSHPEAPNRVYGGLVHMSWRDTTTWSDCL